MSIPPSQPEVGPLTSPSTRPACLTLDEAVGATTEPRLQTPVVLAPLEPPTRPDTLMSTRLLATSPG